MRVVIDVREDRREVEVGQIGMVVVREMAGLEGQLLMPWRGPFCFKRRDSKRLSSDHPKQNRSIRRAGCWNRELVLDLRKEKAAQPIFMRQNSGSSQRAVRASVRTCTRDTGVMDILA